MENFNNFIDIDYNKNLSNEEFMDKIRNKYKIYPNTGQVECILTIDGSNLVVAVPGAGKTLSICIRLYNMVSNYSIDPSRILAVTFSKASAKDMQDKFNKLFQDDLIENIPNYNNNPVKFSTIHSFAYRILREYSNINNMYFKLIEQNKKKVFNNIYNDICKENITDDVYESIVGTISYCKNKLMSLEEIKNNHSEVHTKFFDIFMAYEKYKKDNNYIDYDDMLCMSLEILNSNKNIKDKYSNMYDYVLVDEGQDTSNVQFEIIKIVAGNKNNICCVGDDDQSIYEWRSAEVDNFLYFDKYFPNTKKIFMEQNYRSTKKIVEVSNRFIKSNEKRYNKDLYTENEEGENIKIIECQSYTSQIEFIVNELQHKSNLKDTAIIFRNNISAFTVGNLFLKKHIPFYIRGYKESFFNHWVLKDILSFFNFAMFPKDTESFERIAFRMGRYISGKMLRYIKENDEDLTVYDKLLKMEELKSYQRENIITLRQEFTRLKNKHPRYAINYICDELGYLNYLEKVSTDLGLSLDGLKEIIFILKEISEDCEDVYDFEDKIYSFQDELDNAKNNYGENVVTLTTCHSSKGLEWDNVYMIDLNDGVFPSFKAIKSAIDGDTRELEAERRLYYVGMTRAKKQLNLIHCVSRNGKTIQPSIFTKEVYDRCPEYIDTKSFTLYKEENRVQLFDMSLERVEKLKSLIPIQDYDIEEEQTSFFDTKVRKPKKHKKNVKKLDNSNLDNNSNSKYAIGSKIVHKVLGEGEIKKVNGDIAEILFNTNEIKKINLDMCERNNLITFL